MRLVSAGAIMQLMQKYPNVPAGLHLVTLVREELFSRLDARLKQMAATETVQDELLCLSLDEQVRLFNAPYDPQNRARGATARSRTCRSASQARCWPSSAMSGCASTASACVCSAWRTCPSAHGCTWNMAVTGLGNPRCALRHDRRGAGLHTRSTCRHGALLPPRSLHAAGRPHQAIRPGNASYAQIREVFERLRSSIEDCQLLTSYRSTPEITALFAGLLPESERMQISAVLRRCAAGAHRLPHRGRLRGRTFAV